MRNNIFKNKGLIALSLFIMLGLQSLAQIVPQGFNYQAVARDKDGFAVKNRNIVVEITIYQGSANGTIVWQEGHDITTNEFGLFTIVIGSGVTTGVGTLSSFDKIGWASDHYWTRVRVDFGNGLRDMGTVKLQSVPYAMVADSVANFKAPQYLTTDTVVSKIIEVQQLKLPNGANNGYFLVSDATGNVSWQAVAGDVVGSNGTLQVQKLKGIEVSSGTPNTGDVMTFDGTRWNYAAPTGNQYYDGQGIRLSNDSFHISLAANSGLDLSSGDLSINAGNGLFINSGVLEAQNANPIWNASQLYNTNIDNALSPTDGQVLKWNIATGQWEAQNDAGLAYKAGNGIVFGTDTIKALLDPNGGLNFNGLGEIGINAGTGLNINSGVLDADNATALWNANQLFGTAIDNTLAPANGQVLKWNATTSQWEAQADATGGGGGGSFVAADGLRFNVAQDSLFTDLDPNGGLTYNGSGQLTVSTGVGLNLSSGAVSAQNTNPLWNANQIQSQTISATVPTNGQVLTFNGTQWVPQNPTGATYNSGTGINIVGNTINALNTNAIWNSDQIQGNPVSAVAPTTTGQVLKWDQTVGEWQVGTDQINIYNGGTGITVDNTNNIINADSNSAIWNASQLQSIDVANVVPGNNQVLTYDSINKTWKPVTFAVTGATTFSGGPGISIGQTGNNITITNTGDTNALDDITTSTVAGGDLSGTYPNPNVIGIQGSAVTSTVPSTTGQILKWNNITSEWELGTDDNTSYIAGTGINIAGGTISALNANNIWNANQIQNQAITSTAPSTTGQILKWNQTAAEWQLGTDDNTSYAAGDGMNLNGTTFEIDLAAPNSGLQFDGSGDLQIGAGTGLTITGSTLDATNTTNMWNADQIQNIAVSTTAPTNGQVLVYNGTQWVPQNQTGGGATYTGGSGITISATNVINADSNRAIWNANMLQGVDITSTAPSTDGQVLKWNQVANEWQLGTDNNTSYTAGTGIDITGTTISALNTNNIWNANQIQNSAVTSTAPNVTGQILKWNNTTSEWELGTDDNTSYTAGTGIDITGTTISALNTNNIWNANQIQNSAVTTTAPSTTGQILKWNQAASEWQLGTDDNTSYTAGTGIDITGTTISALNTNNIWNANQIQNSAVTSTAPSVTGQILKWNNTTSEWELGTDDNTSYTAGTGIDITGTTISALNTNNIWNANQIQNSAVTSTAPSVTGQILKWNNATSEWELGTDDNTTYTAGTGIDITGTTISALNTNNIWNADQIQNSAVTTTAPSTTGQILKWNQAASEWQLGTDDNTTYTAGDGLNLIGTTFEVALAVNSGLQIDGAGDLLIGAGTGLTATGNTLNATNTVNMWNADQIQNSAVTTTAPSTTGQILKWNQAASEWQLGTDDNTTYTAGTAIQITGGNVINALVSNSGGLSVNGSNEIIINDGNGLQIDGTNTLNATSDVAMWNADQLQGHNITATAPSTTGQILKWNQTAGEWQLGNDVTSALIAGNGIDINASDTIKVRLHNNSGLFFNNGQISIGAGTGLSISGQTLNAATTSPLWNANKIQGQDVTNTAPSTTGQILEWNQTLSQWVLGSDDNTTYTDGTGITFNGTQINADNTTAMWNANQLQGNDISTTNPTLNGQVLVWNSTTSEWEPTFVRDLADTDGDTKIQVEESADEDMIRFDIAGNEAMIIDDNEYVGIGTSSPNSHLEINGSMGQKVTVVSTTTTLDDSYNIILVNNAAGIVTINLPSASSCAGRIYTIKAISTGFVTIDPNGVELIDGSAVKNIATQYDYITTVSDGANWFIIADN